ncbi:HlyD family efflux transporter periplasmic adaptor subunit [Azospirillum thermophilum]|uniref:HlyD family efflux transporter periplasmic adaptor subunit n=1 Tax=Azospirillum thermophilum TaxID=2202148 RepID=UPI00143D06CB|nr:HlyD family efflux transporter periplasmic adaptor subunit [Azospirillum thermophilum]
MRLYQAQAAAQQFDPEQAARLPVTWQELEGALAELGTLTAQRGTMTVRAPFAGRIAELPEHLKPGSWVASREPLALLVKDGGMVAEGYVAEADIARLAAGAPARFIPDDGGEELALRLATVDVGAVAELEQPELSTTHGGAIAVRPDANGKLIPAEAVYRVTLTPDTPRSEPRSRRGVVVIEGERTSWAERLRRNAVGLFIRESGW